MPIKKTILLTDEVGGLEVQRRDGQWISAPHVSGAYVCNIGDCLMRWTNDVWVSNWHQVVNPPMVNGKSDRRLSLVYFCSTNYDTLVACLPNCSGPGKPALYPPVISGKYAEERFKLRYGIEEPARQSA